VSVTPLVAVCVRTPTQMPAMRGHILVPGLLVTSSVRLIKMIAKGGMGSIWLAEHLALESLVAVKFLSPLLALDPQSVERFLREAQAAAKIQSPHVVQIADCGLLPDGLPFMVMELLAGEDLATRLDFVGTLSVEETLTIAEQVCEGLVEAHALHIIHRDIKPDNIFLTRSAERIHAKILDFGIAKLRAPGSHEITGTGTTLGTPSYMSPEQILGARDVDKRADLWSLAVVLYRCLTGEVPFSGDSFGAACIAIDRGRFPRVRMLRPGLSDDLEPFFEQAFAKEIDDRFADVPSFIQAFRKAIQGKPYVVRETLPEIDPPETDYDDQSLQRHRLEAKQARRRMVFALFGTSALLVGMLVFAQRHPTTHGAQNAVTSVPEELPSGAVSGPEPAESAPPFPEKQTTVSGPSSSAKVAEFPTNSGKDPLKKVQSKSKAKRTPKARRPKTTASRPKGKGAGKGTPKAVPTENKKPLPPAPSASPTATTSPPVATAPATEVVAPKTPSPEAKKPAESKEDLRVILKEILKPEATP
jgi:eukaryotic-like serine/threonine-protein kinase